MLIATAARWSKTQVLKMNLFDSVESRSNAIQLRIALISTRIYIILLMLTIVNLVTYTSLIAQTQTVTIQKPSQKIYTMLQEKYQNSLSCPCENIAMDYTDVINISIKYHPVCESQFISDTWIEHLFISNIIQFLPIDIRLIASSHFQLLATLCSTAQRSVQNAVHDLFSKTLLTKYLLLSTSLNIQIHEEIWFALNSTANTLRQQNEYIRKTIQSNQLETAFTTPMSIEYITDQSVYFAYQGFTFTPTSIDKNASMSCNCVSMPNCSIQSMYYGVDAVMNPIGFVAACYPIEGVLQSTLECLFDRTCLQSILSIFGSINVSSIDVLKINETKFSPNTVIEILANELFIDDSLISSSFSNYYEKCAPVSCIYTFTQTGSALFVITTLLGLIGGISIVLRLFTFYMVTWWCNRSVDRHEPTIRVSLMERIRTIWKRMKTLIIEMNLFETAESNSDPFELITERITTRVYFVSLVISIVIVVFYTSISVRMQSETIKNPLQSTFQTLYDNYESTLHCPCSEIAVSYGSFISISPVFHPICTSWLISNEWIQYIADQSIRDPHPIDDFRMKSAGFFNVLATLCDLAKTTVSNAWRVVNHSALVTDETLPRNDLSARSNATITLFQTSAIAEFKRSLSIIELQTQSSLILDEGNVKCTTVQLFEDEISRFKFYTEPSKKMNCTCGFDDNCVTQMKFYMDIAGAPSVAIFSVPNLFIGCSAIDSVRVSSIECFVNQSCLDRTRELTNTPLSPLTLDTPILIMNGSRFLPNTSLSIVINDLMVDQWNVKTEYEQYYNQCQPLQCSYTFTTRGGLLFIVSTIIGIFGGLIVILKLVVKIIVKLIRNRMRPRMEDTNTRVRFIFSDYMRNLMHLLKKQILHFNLFESKLSWNDAQRRQTEIITTRVYLALLFVCIIIASIYTSSMVQTHFFTENNPSKATFNELISNPSYSSTLECPCQNLTIPYNRFVQIVPRFHQICSSDFVVGDSNWIKRFSQYLFNSSYSYDDFRRFVAPQFRALAALCNVANVTVADSLSTFMSNTLISKRVETTDTIQSQVNSTIAQFYLSTNNAFALMFDFVKDIMKGNRVISTTLSNWYIDDFLTEVWYFVYVLITFSPRSYENGTCFCGGSQKCLSPAIIDGWVVPGFRVGCYPIESLLESTLECLYSVTCINNMQSNDVTWDIDFRALNSTLSSPTVTVQSLVNALMIDQWETTFNYENYYSACAPLRCSYSVNTRFDKVYVFATIMGLSGGLTVILKFVVPLAVKCGRRISMFRRRRVQQMVITVSERA